MRWARAGAPTCRISRRPRCHVDAADGDRLRQPPLRDARAHPRRAVAAHAELDTRAANFAQAPFTGGQTRVLNLSDDPNASDRPGPTWRVLAGRPDPDGQRRLLGRALAPVRRRRRLRPERLGDARHRAPRLPTASSSPARAGRSCSSTSRWPASACGRSRRRSPSAPSTPAARASAPPAPPAPTAASSAPRRRSRTPADACTSSPTPRAPARWNCVLYARTGTRSRVLVRQDDRAVPHDATAPASAERRPRRRGPGRARRRGLAGRDQRLGHAAAAGQGRTAPRRQPERPAGLHRQPLRLSGAADLRSDDRGGAEGMSASV